MAPWLDWVGRRSGLLVLVLDARLRDLGRWPRPERPYDTEEILVRLHDRGQQATVASRNQVQDVLVPDRALPPDWTAPTAAARDAEARSEVLT